MGKWDGFLNDKRFSEIFGRTAPESTTTKGEPKLPDFAKSQTRNEIERDHDRILFSTPLRRMGDKTQLFPLESIESIRTRLTHSFEVANLARSIGVELAISQKDTLPKDAIRTIPSMLSAVGLAHDIGNPPFGHQGEEAIKSWFKRNSTVLFEPDDSGGNDARNEDIAKLTEQHKNDFLLFEGNAQALRVLTKLQVIGDDLGLNLSVGTLAASMKYIAASNATNTTKPARKKVGFFTTEQSLVKKIRQEVGLQGDARHPLALVMEACDDIAYSVIDAEDSIKKGLISFNDLLACLKREEKDPLTKYVHDISLWEYDNLAQQQLEPAELSDVATQKFRVHAIHVMISAAIKTFNDHYGKIIAGTFDGDLIGHSHADNLCKTLKIFERENAFKHKTVLGLELKGYNTINRLMDYLWIGISEREEYSTPASKRTSPFAAYVYSRISRNYRRVFEGKVKRYHQDALPPIRYRELQLLTDMISGMTDRFCIELCEELQKHQRIEQAADG